MPSGDPFQVTIAPFENPDPLAARVNAALPAIAVFGEMLVRAGGAAVTVKVSGAGDVCPGAVTPTDAVPAVATRLAGTDAFSVVELVKFVLSAAPFQVTPVAEVKPEPLTANVKAEDPATTLVGKILLRTRGAAVMVKVRGVG